MPRQLLCTTCRRTPDVDSPTYPHDYLTLPAGGRERTCDYDYRAPSDAVRQRQESMDEDEKAAVQRKCLDCDTIIIPNSPRHQRCTPCATNRAREQNRTIVTRRRNNDTTDS